MKVGYYSASTFTAIGPRPDMEAFFDVVNAFVVPLRPDVNFSIITENLYRRYIRQDRIDHAKQIMHLIQDELSKIEPSALYWKKIKIDAKHSELNLNLDNLFECFAGYFRGFYRSIDRSTYFFEHGDDYTPVRIIRCETPYNLADSKRSLKAFDQIEGTPFWLMPDEVANAGSRWFEHPKLVN